MPSCPHGHATAESVAFCHECGAPVPSPAPRRTDLHLYVSLVSLVVIVLGTFAIVWLLEDHGTSREAAETDASVSVCGLPPAQRPTSLALGCGGIPGSLTDVTWSEWGAASARGTGSYSSGGRTVPAIIVLSGAKATAKGSQFTRLTVTPSGEQPIAQAIGDYGSGASTASAHVPLGGALCPRSSGSARLGVVGTHTSCDFAAQVRRSYLAAGGHGQALTVAATSTITHRRYRDIGCSAGTYVVCVGGEDDSATVFFGPFD